MNEITPTVGLIILISGFITYKGFKKEHFFDKYKFWMGKILNSKEYVRLVSSGFLHVNWNHFIFNMLTLFFFGLLLEVELGAVWFVLLYFVSMVGGDLFAILFRKNDLDYMAVGASGAISGVVFASIALFPGMKMGLLFLPIMIPSWAFGLLYVAYTIFGIKSRKDNIGHEAHLGGGITGMSLAILYSPQVLETNLIPVLLILLPTVSFFIYSQLSKNTKTPTFIRKISKSDPYKNLTLDEKYNAIRADKQKEIDQLLDKINNKGMQSLSRSEKQRLEELSK
ncbi:rhomboid family intramembrane serine protease [Bacteroidia bacterium]|nr:rhomboid family intramembrane serine protease [Bacteroidia bacterium]MDC1395180.1 rhomboid family intramembrane serine protease [Bacteroidia bacterium]